MHSPVASIAALLFAATAIPLLILGFQPAIEVHETHLAVGRRILPWADIRRVDRVHLSPLLVRLALADGSRMLLVYGGRLDSCNGLLNHLRRSARQALIEGQDYRQYWGEPSAAPPKIRTPAATPRYHLLRPDDEAEVERLYQRLKTVGNLDPKNSNDSK